MCGADQISLARRSNPSILHFVALGRLFRTGWRLQEWKTRCKDDLHVSVLITLLVATASRRLALLVSVLMFHRLRFHMSDVDHSGRPYDA